MTNEELATAIQQGQTELIPQLWERVHRIYYLKCNEMYARYEDLFIAHGITIRDLEQECYTAFLESIRGYTAESGLKFSSYIKYPLLKVQDKLLFKRRTPNPLDGAVSLNTPLHDDGHDPGELIEQITDNGRSPEQYASVQSMLDIVNAAVERLNDNERFVIKAYFYDEKTLAETAEQLNVSRQRAAQIKDTALNKLRQDKQIMSLQNVYNDG